MRQQSILPILMITSLMLVSVSKADTIVVETNTDGTISTSTVTVPNARALGQVGSVDLQIQSLMQELQQLVGTQTATTTKALSTPKKQRAVPADKYIQDIIFATGGQRAAGASAVACKDAFTINIRRGYTGAEALAVQRFLNTDEDTLVSNEGVGSIGKETNYFGTLSVAAVKKFQQKYAKEVLASVGLNAPTGYWGPSTRKMANRLAGCAK